MITLIILTILCTNLFINPANSVSTIKFGDQLNISSELVSPGNNFTLGFFPIPATNFTYLGIWYTNDDQARRVWVANPSIPLISNSGVLMINPNTSKLVISSGGTTLVNISDNQSGPDSNLIASLEDTGAFTLSWEPNGESSQRLVIRQRGNPYWTSGDYLNNQTFEYMSLNNPFSQYWYNLSYVYNNDERYFSYRDFNGVMPMWTLRPDGIIEDGDSRFLWSPEFCYGYESDRGCVASSNLPQCRSDDDIFREMNGDFSPAMTSDSYDSNASLILSDCMMRCWNDCSCLGFERGSSNGTGCRTWTGTKSVNNFTVNVQGVAASNKYVLISSTTSKGNARNWIWAPIVIGIFLVIFCPGLLWFLKKRKLTQEEEAQNRDDEYFLELMASESFKGASNIERNGRKGRDALKLEDPTLGDTCVIQQLLRTIHVALLCVQENALDRPLMSDVISMLINDTMLLPAPKHPAFFYGTTPSKSTSVEAKSENHSVNQITITEMSARASGTNITFVNNCGFTVWPGISGTPNFNTTGFELRKGNSISLEAPSGWNVGRIWGRTGCNFNVSGNGSCTSGDCGTGEVECNGNLYNNKLPTTIAEFGLNQFSQDYYAVSLVNGYNLPLLIEPTGGSGSDLRSCAKTGCIDDLIQRCPPELRSEGGCMTPCQALGYPEYCCVGTETCNSYAQFFKSACPTTNRTIFDNDDEATPFTCSGSDYTIRFCPASDSFSTMKLGSQLKSGDQLLSSLGNFTLGFFDEDYKYLGIWYTSDVESKKVWVANPDDPIVSVSKDHALSIDAKTGNLIITSASSTLMRITDVDVGPNPNVTAALEKNGNFVLINEIDKKILWQSFDHPTNVLLPGMKLGYDTTIGKNWTLTSWLSKEIPNSGTFTLSWEPIEEASQRLMIRRRGKPYWTSGNINSQRFQYLFALNNPGSQSRFYNLTSVYTNEAKYFSYDSSNADLPMWILTPKGQIRDSDYSWTPEFCYGYDSSDGCVKGSSLPQCRREGDNFSEKNGEFDPDKSQSVTDNNSSLSISDCFVKCWNDCSCVGFNSSNTNETGCVIWTGSNNFFANPRGNSTLKYVIYQNPISLGTGNKQQKSKKWLWILISVVIPLVFLCLGLLWCIKKRKHRQEEHERQKRDELFLELTASESFKDIHQLETDGMGVMATREYHGTERPNTWKYLCCTTILEDRPCRPFVCARKCSR
ncbi:Apple-like protein [Artemisia annua]|uniref:Apple-like protein n=1 Tax=Artemisia annua TaxID=35608 RepID=A0A2U1PG62_ARTAN|nr:Apple-like protein [Artemisia annua]